MNRQDLHHKPIIHDFGELEMLDKHLTCGMYFTKESKGYDGAIHGWHTKWTYQLGFDNSTSEGYTLSCIADGMLKTFKSKTSLCNWLEKYQMQPTTPEMLKKIFKYKVDSQEYYLGKL